MTILRPERTPLRYWPALLTRALQNGISTAFSGEPAGLANALVTGDKDGLTDSFNAQPVSYTHLAKPSQLDERYMKRAEDLLHGELAYALGISKESVPDYITRVIEPPKQ